jgi:hypothetical protein
MVASVQRTKALYESYLSRNPDGSPRTSNPGAARAAFVNDFRHRLGLCSRDGQDHKDHTGNRVLREAADPSVRVRSEDFSFLELMESIVGPEARQFAESGEAYGAWKAQSFSIANRHPNDPRALLEAPGVGISPSAFADINAWTAINSGLIERRILEPFQDPEFIGEIICPNEQTRIAEGQKVIGAARTNPALRARRNPGQTHARTAFGERYITLPRTNEQALAIDVTFEAGFFDLTGQVLEHASSIGEDLAYGLELDRIDAVLGVPGSTGNSTDPNAFNYKGTAYAQFADVAVAPIVPQNSQVNPLANGDWSTIKSSWLLLQRMYDPERLTRIRNSADTILTGLEGEITADLICGASDTQRRTTGGATQATAGTLTIQNNNMNPAAMGGRFGVKRILTSPLVDQRMTDATGLNLSASAAASHWLQLSAGKSHKTMVNWPLTMNSVPAGSSYEMTDRRLVQSTFVSMRYTPSVW